MSQSIDDLFTIVNVMTSTLVLTSLKPVSPRLTTTSTILSTSTVTLDSTFSGNALAKSSSASTSSTSTTSRTTITPTSRPSESEISPLKISSSSSAIGLAVGIPMAVLGVCTVIVLIWFFLKKRKFAAALAKNSQFKSNEGTSSNPYETFKTKNSLSRPKSTLSFFKWDKGKDEALIYKAGPQRQPNVQSNFFRESAQKEAKTMRDTPITARGDADELSKRGAYERVSGFFSPMLLKKFNLSNLMEVRTPPRMASTPNSSAGSVERVHGSTPPLPSLTKKPLPFPPVISSEKTSTSLSKMENVVETNPFSDRVQSLDSQACVVIRAYEKQLDDEISLAVGERVCILKSHSDGWCLVTKESGSKGMVPKLCLMYKSSSKAVANK